MEKWCVSRGQQKLFRKRLIHTAESNPDVKEKLCRTEWPSYVNLARCYMLQGMLDKTHAYIEKNWNAECASYYEDIDILYVDCLKARYYHLIHNYVRRDAQIQEIVENKSNKKMCRIMEVFDDLCDFCGLMLEIGRMMCCG